MNRTRTGIFVLLFCFAVVCSDAISQTTRDDDARNREQAARDVYTSFSLLLDELGLDTAERDDLVALLIEDRIASMWTPHKRGVTIAKEAQSKRIADVIGKAKTQEFRALERNGGAYWEVQKISDFLAKHDVPLDRPQLDGLLAILIKTRGQQAPAPVSETDRRSLEYLENRLIEMDDYQRFVVELAPSVLSPPQVVLLSDKYQEMSYQRTNALELQKRRRLDNPAERRSWWYPAPWSN